jgi:hypothetical protein
MKPRIMALVAIVLLFASVSPLSAQDVRLSPPSYTRRLPTEFRIQSAGGVGDQVLAVWGTTVPAADSQVVGELRMQLLQQGELVGDERPIHSSAGRPFGFVQVIPLTGSYLVLWNDRRVGAPGIYARRIDTAGNFLDDEQRVSPGSVVPDATGRITTLGDRSSGLALLWDDHRTGHPALYHLGIDSLGRARGTERRLGGALLGVRTLTGLPGLWLLSVSDGSSALVHADGSIDIVSVLGKEGWAHAHLGADMALAVLDSDQIHIYRSPVDSGAGHVVALPALHGGVAGSATLSRDSTGDYVVHFATVDVTGSENVRGWIIARIYSLIVHGDAVTGPRFVDSLMQPNGYPDPNFTRSWALCAYKGTTVERGCDNGYLVGVRFNGKQYRDRDVVIPDYTATLSYAIDGGGRYTPWGTGFQYACDPPPPVVPIVRSASDTASIVSVGADHVTLQAPVASLRLFHDDHDPALVVRSGELLLGWLRRYDTVSAMLIRVPRGPQGAPADVAITQADGVPYKLGSTGCQEELLTPLIEERKLVAASGDGYGAAVESSTCIAHIARHCIEIPQTQSEYDACTSVKVPTIAGWATPIYYARGPQWTPAGPYASRIMGYDPDGHELLVRVELNPQQMEPELHLIAIDDTGAIAWKIDAPLRASASIVPIGPARYLGIVGSHTTVIDGSDSVASFDLPGDAVGAFHRRLHGDRFLRGFLPDSATPRLRLQLFTLQGRLLGERSIDIPSGSGALAIVQRPSDTSLSLIRGTREGVRLTQLDGDLRPVIVDSLISATHDSVGTVTGAYIGDSLFVAWEDYRERERAIYGTSRGIVVPRRGDVAAVRSEPHADMPTGASHGAHLLGIVPLPALDHATVIVKALSRSSATLELVDMLGRRLLLRTLDGLAAGEHRLDLDLSPLSPGTYFVRLHADEGDEIGRLTVVR